MTNRLHVQVTPSARIVLSKPGYDASTPLTDDKKVFDSDWAFCGSIVEMGYKTVVYNTQVGNNNLYTMVPIYFNNPLNYIPAAYVYTGDQIHSGMPIRAVFRRPDLTNVRALSIIYNDRIEVPNRILGGNVLDNPITMTVGYMLFGV